MEWESFYAVSPEAQRHFREQYASSRLPSQAEYEAKLAELNSSGQSYSANELSGWWAVIPKAFKVDSFAPTSTPVESVQRNKTDETFELLGSFPAYEAPEDKRSYGWVIPAGVGTLVLTLFVSAGAVTISNELDRAQEQATYEASLEEPATEDFTYVEVDPKSLLESRIDEESLDLQPGEKLLGHSEVFGEVEIYGIRKDMTIFPEPEADVAAAWDNVRKIFGRDVLELNTFTVARNGLESGVAAYVDFNERTLALAIDKELGGEEGQIFTLVHEYNHLMTMMDQYDSLFYQEFESGQCSTALLLDDTVCIDSESSLYNWIRLFWDEPGMLEGTTTGDLEAGEIRHREMPDEFVNAYAASAPQEDMAESFAYWVLNEEMLSPEKRKFFDRDEASIEAKERILDVLALN